jgi:ATP-dependent Lon protease
MGPPIEREHQWAITLIRKAVKKLISSEKKSVKASADNLADYLGVPKYRYGEVEDKDLIGVVTGLAWTDVGGELLTIEASMMPGKGRLTVTGNLRDVMKESISAAASYVRSRAVAFGIKPRPCLTSATSMSTCRKARRRRMDPPPGSPWPPPSSR